MLTAFGFNLGIREERKTRRILIVFLCMNSTAEEEIPLSIFRNIKALSDSKKLSNTFKAAEMGKKTFSSHNTLRLSPLGESAARLIYLVLESIDVVPRTEFHLQQFT